LLRSAIKNKEIDQGEPLSDEQVQSVVKKEAKKLKESLEAYEDAGRDEQVRAIKTEIAVLKHYLPEQMSDEELTTVVKAVVEETGASSKADLGRVMGAAMARVKGQADGNRVRKIAETLLGAFMVVVAAQGFAPAAHAATLFGVPEARILEYLFRFGRILLVVAGIVGVNMILRGSFKYMISGRRFESRDSAMKSMASGFMGTIVIVSLFSVVTVVLQKMA